MSDDDLNQDEPETVERDVYITHRLRIDVSPDAKDNDILDHPEITAPACAEIIDWGFDCAISQRR